MLIEPLNIASHYRISRHTNELSQKALYLSTLQFFKINPLRLLTIRPNKGLKKEAFWLKKTAPCFQFPNPTLFFFCLFVFNVFQIFFFSGFVLPCSGSLSPESVFWTFNIQMNQNVFWTFNIQINQNFVIQFDKSSLSWMFYANFEIWRHDYKKPLVVRLTSSNILLPIPNLVDKSVLSQVVNYWTCDGFGGLAHNRLWVGLDI